LETGFLTTIEKNPKMHRETLAQIDKVTAKTIFEDNVFYMITWKDRDDKQNTWKPSEYFDQNEYLSSLVTNFEEEMKQSEEELFKRLERDEMNKKNKNKDKKKKGDHTGFDWVRNYSKNRNGNGMNAGDAESLDEETIARALGIQDFVKFGNLKQGSKEGDSEFVDTMNFNKNAIEEENDSFIYSNKPPAIQNKNGFYDSRVPVKNMEDANNEIRWRQNEEELDVMSRAGRSNCSATEDLPNQEKESLRKKKLALFYEFELREKVFDFKNFGHKVLSDLKIFSEASRAKQVMSVRHAAMLKKLSVNE
jgi:hypothetical protein